MALQYRKPSGLRCHAYLQFIEQMAAHANSNTINKLTTKDECQLHSNQTKIDQLTVKDTIIYAKHEHVTIAQI